MLPLIALTLATAARSDSSELVDWLVKILGVGIFVGLPLIKSIVQSREKSKEDAQKEGRRAARSKESEGRRAFEQLMRGEPSAAPLPIPPVVPPASDSTARGAQRAATAARRLSDLEGMPERPLTGAEFEAQEGLPERELVEVVEQRKREEQRRQEAELRVPEKIAREEYAAASSLREDVAPVPVEVFRTPSFDPARATSSSDVARGLFGSGRGADRRAALRRSLVLNEVLGRPVALRAGPDGSSPVGFAS